MRNEMNQDKRHEHSHGGHHGPHHGFHHEGHRPEERPVDDGKPILEVRDLCVEYTSGKKITHAVNRVSFDLRRGETLCLVGESGCGKSTVAKAILRILPDRGARISGGSMVFKGQDLAAIPEKEMQKIRGAEIAMVFQDPMTALNPVKRILKQISSVVELHNPEMSKKDAQGRAYHMLKTVGITPDRAMDYPHQFSGGMQQRVVVAIGLSCKPELLLADEPTTALDVTIQAQVLDMMMDLVHRHNTAMILITHNLGVVAETGDYVGVVYGGEIVEYGSKREIFKNPCHPYTIGLFGALPDMQSEGGRLKPIEGIMPEPSDLPAGCKFHTRCPYATDICSEGDVPVIELGGTHRCQCHNIEAVRKANGREAEA